MLSPYRVLDLTDDRGLICGQILADLGADVIAVEPPGGNPARRLGPFVNDEPHPERSLYWWAYSRNKRSVTLDIESEDGQEKLRELVRRADFLIESYDPGYLAERGLGYDDLAGINPALVYVSITPFGQDGPKARYAATDLIVEAAGGNLVLQGDDDRPPVRVSVPQAFLHAGAEAAGAALIAHHERQRSGLGQHVDVSAQQAVNQATFSSSLVNHVGAQLITRVAGGLKYGPWLLRWRYPAKDGYVSILFLFGSAIGPMTRRLMEYIHEQGFCDEATRDKDWIAYTELLLTGREPVEELARVQDVIAAFTKTKTKTELLSAALERGLLMAPITTMAEVVKSEQLAERSYWQPLEHPELGETYRYPGPFVKLSRTGISYRQRPPTLGEHNRDVLAESNGNSTPGQTSSVSRGESSRGQPPLADVKILDLMWVMAGPAATRVLADYGATIVRVESSHRIDTARTLAPLHNAEAGPENSGMFINLNAGKLGATLNPTKEEGRAVILDLVRWADVVTESFSPKAMRAWNLDYESLRAVKPDIIMLSSCLMGQSGPLSEFAGYGNLSAAISGFYEISGWPDRPPAGPYGAYTDAVSPRFSVAAILAALEYRRRTGRGQYIDQSQAEASLHFLGPALLDYTVNGRVQQRVGNRDSRLAPHGVYPAAGDDRWVAISVAADEQWRALCSVMGREELAGDSRFATPGARLAREDELDEMLAEWTKPQDAEEVEATLQSRGVPASVVQNSKELYADPQLLQRGHFVEVPHEIHGTTTVEGSRFKLSRTPARIERSGPTFGRDNQHVLETILGYSPERIAELAAAGVLE